MKHLDEENEQMIQEQKQLEQESARIKIQNKALF